MRKWDPRDLGVGRHRDQTVLRLDAVVTPSRARRGATAVSMRLEEGSVLRLSGPNGCGKSELCDCIAGRVVARSGLRTAMGPSELGYASSALTATDFRTRDLFSATRRARSADEPAEVWTRRWEVGELWDKKLGRMSRGQRERVQLALAFLGVPRLVVLDEVLGSLDDHALGLVAGELHHHLGRGGAAIVVEHRVPPGITVHSTQGLD